MTLKSARVERLQKLETAQQLTRDRHDGAPVIELAAILDSISIRLAYEVVEGSHLVLKTQ
jgi:hypothetical protein